jgi:hypothetical protein
MHAYKTYTVDGFSQSRNTRHLTKMLFKSSSPDLTFDTVEYFLLGNYPLSTLLDKMKRESMRQDSSEISTFVLHFCQVDITWQDLETPGNQKSQSLYE